MATGATVVVAANQPAGWVASSLPATALAAGSYYLVLVSGTTSNAAFVYFRSRCGDRWRLQRQRDLGAVGDVRGGEHGASEVEFSCPADAVGAAAGGSHEHGAARCFGYGAAGSDVDGVDGDVVG